MLPICILTIQDEDDRAYMSRLFVRSARCSKDSTFYIIIVFLKKTRKTKKIGCILRITVLRI